MENDLGLYTGTVIVSLLVGFMLGNFSANNDAITPSMWDAANTICPIKELHTNGEFTCTNGLIGNINEERK
jgi:hypothetical protein